ncbi:MAG: UDP-N-acetylglucosamine 1-carboxyvinyltransferase [Bifidobacteriaceae bacterium]|jgi:UDP-N-acetylglucosamine 1-carboxyvinyltransferase|nr:UDP-N-acetylglucosamine 1-carboxyvinyltransferase [Bifidobacteriaceae bacterium]
MTQPVLQVTGGRPLTGQVTVRGAKNLVSKAMVAALLTAQPSRISNVPTIRDVEVVCGLLRLHGAQVEHDPATGQVLIEPDQLSAASLTNLALHAGASRIPILLCGPLLHRLGQAFIPTLGGCEIGGRPIDFHLEALRRFGAEITKRPSGVWLTAPNRLKGIELTLEYPSVGATEQLLLSAVLADGVTTLRNAAVEPEILDLVCVLQKMGAIISIQTDRVITIEGVGELTGFTHTAMPDRIEAASWAAAALVTGGRITVAGARQTDMMTFLNVFRQVGGAFTVTDQGIDFYRANGVLQSVALETNVHPGFMTDWQQPMVVALTQADGLSVIHETVYEQRFGFTEALRRRGAQIQLYRDCLGGMRCRFGQRNHQHSAVVAGPTPLHAAEIAIPDLRGGFSHVIAALAASGQSTVHGIGLIERGYEHFSAKLEALGAQAHWTQED